MEGWMGKNNKLFGFLRGLLSKGKKKARDQPGFFRKNELYIIT